MVLKEMSLAGSQEELGVVEQAHNPIAGEAEAGGSLGLTGQSA